MAERIEGLNLVLLGKIGAGKSASGNTILGRKAFESKESFSSVTQDVAVEYGWVCGRQVTVYDTPGLFNTKLSEEQIQQMINVNVLQRCESGPTVFLLVIKADRFTGKEREAVEKIEKLLGEERLKKTWILFTGRDELEEENKSIDEFVYETEALMRLVQKYDQRYHVFNNKKREPNGQVQELLTKIYSTYPDTIEKGAKPKRTQTGRRNQDVFDFIDVNSVFRSPVKHVRMRTMTMKYTDKKFLRSFFGHDEPNTSRRIVLLGKTGVGKSASGNTILGQKEFRSERRMFTVTCECSDAHATVSGRSVSVVDTPGFFHTEMKTEESMREIARSVYISSPGPHAFLIVFPVNMRITEEDQQILQQIKMLFGEEVLKYSIILFTHGDLLEGKPMEKLIEENSRLRDLVDQCGGRFHVFNNRDENNRDQVNDLLQKIDTMIEQNGGGHYSNQMYEDAQRLRREEEERRQREEEERKWREEEQRKQQEKKPWQGEIERVRKETEERVRAEFEGPPRFLQERLKIIRLNEEDRKRQEEKWEVIERERRQDIIFLWFDSSEKEMVRKRVEKQKQEEIERVIMETERRIREEFEGPPRFLLERFKLMRLREEAEKTHREEIERVRKETEERVRAEFEGTPRFLQERLKATTLSEEEKKTQQEEKQKQEEIERVKKETEERVRAEFEGPPRFLLERLKLRRLREEAEKTHQEEIERVRKETEERVRAEFEGPPRFLKKRLTTLRLSMEDRIQKHVERQEKQLLLERFKLMRLREEAKKTHREEKQRREEIERVKKETEEKIRAEFEGPPRFLQERLTTLRLSMEDRIQKHVERQEKQLERLERYSSMRDIGMYEWLMEMREMEMREMEMREMEIREMEMREMEMREMKMREMKMRTMEMREMEMREMKMREMKMRTMEMRTMEMREMGMRRMEMIRMRMRRELQEEIDRVIKEMEENIRAEFKCPPR